MLDFSGFLMAKQIKFQNNGGNIMAFVYPAVKRLPGITAGGGYLFVGSGIHMTPRILLRREGGFSDSPKEVFEINRFS